MSARVIRPGAARSQQRRRCRSEQVERIRRQARAALRANLPVTWLAMLLYGLATQRPKGTSPATGRVAALMMVTASWANGAYARPGRFFSAAILDCSERTVMRHWRLIERLGMATVTARGTWLSAARRAEIASNPLEEDRWRDRQEWRLLMPAWAADLSVDDAELLDRCTTQAAELLDELTRAVEHRTRRADPPGRTGPTAPIPRGPRPSPRPVDNRPAGRPRISGRVAPSGGWFCSHYLSQSIGLSFSRPNGRKMHKQTGAPPAHSSTRGRTDFRSFGKRPQVPREAVELAVEVISRGHLPWLVRSPQWMLISALRRFAAAGWRAEDVELAAQARLDQRRFTTPAGGPDKPVRYLRWLLDQADLTQPPAQARDEALARGREELLVRAAARRGEQQAQEAAAARARGGAGHQAFRQQLGPIGSRSAERRARERRAEQEAREQVAAQARAASRATLPVVEREDRLCAGGCGTLGPEVVLRKMPNPTPVCPSCWSQMAPLWT